MTQNQIKEVTILYLEVFLPDALRKALDSYKVYVLGAKDSIEASDFKEHHNACKVAISHIELLLKLVQWVDLPTNNNQEKISEDQLSKMVAEAKQHLKQHKEK